MAQTEGAQFWLPVMNELKNRGVDDIFISCCDGLKGFSEAIESLNASLRKITKTCCSFPNDKVVMKVSIVLGFVSSFKKVDDAHTQLETGHGAVRDYVPRSDLTVQLAIYTESFTVSKKVVFYDK